MRHVFLTGDIQTGKSTILRRYLERHPDLRVGGLRTVWKNGWSVCGSSSHPAMYR